MQKLAEGAENEKCSTPKMATIGVIAKNLQTFVAMKRLAPRFVTISPTFYQTLVGSIWLIIVIARSVFTSEKTR